MKPKSANIDAEYYPTLKKLNKVLFAQKIMGLPSKLAEQEPFFLNGEKFFGCFPIWSYSHPGLLIYRLHLKVRVKTPSDFLFDMCLTV